MPRLSSNVPEYVVALRQRGVTLSQNGEKISYKAPKGTLTADDIAYIRQNKHEFIDYLVKDGLSIKDLLKESVGDEVFQTFSLTDIQSSYLMGKSDIFEYGGLSCQIYVELQYDDLKPKRVEDIWNVLISRHDMLRVSITPDSLQRVRKDVPKFIVKANDLRNLDRSVREERLSTIRDEFSHKVFDVERGYAFDVQVTQLDSYDLLNFSIEFIVADWASIWLLLSEFEGLYFDEDYTLKPLDLTFRDYQLAYTNLQDSISYAEDKQYWCNRIESLPLAPQLPIEGTSNKVGNGFTRYDMCISAERYAQFKEKTKKYGITPTVAVVTAYACVLERWSKNKKFSINLTVLNRLPIHEQIMDIVGDFTSINLLETDVSNVKTFVEYSLQVGNQLFKDMEHRLFSGVEVIRELAKVKGNKNSLMPIVFTSAIGLNSTSIKGKMTDACISQTPQVFIDCQAMDGDFGLRINWDVRDGIFPDGLVESMFSVFEDLINRLSIDDTLWHTTNFVSIPSEQKRLLDEVNSTQKGLPEHLLHSKILERYYADSSKVAIVQDGINYTYEDVVLYASTVADGLKRLNVRPQDYVAVMMPKSVYQVYAVLGILSAQCVYVPIDSQQARDRKKTIIKNANVKVVLTLSSVARDYGNDVTIIDVDTLEKSKVNTLETVGSLDNPAYVIHTSGSTGVPKGVVVSHRSAVNTIEDVNQRFGITSKDTAIGLSQLYFDLSVYDVFGLLSVGGTVVYPNRQRYTDPSHWFELVEKYNVTLWNSAPAFMKIFINYVDSNVQNLPNLRLVMLSGDWIALDLFDSIKKYNSDIRCISLGGATEASIWSILYEYQRLDPSWASIPYGKPMANQGFRVLDSKLQDCPLLVEGELYITGLGLASGYLNNPEETESKFFRNPYDNQMMYKTGDMGRYMPDGNIEFLGREDFQVKVMGYRIELGEVENSIQRYPDVTNVTVVAMGKDTEEKKLYAYVEVRGFKSNYSQPLEDTLKEFLNGYLPKYMVPQRIFFTDNIPLTSNGKVDRKAVVETVGRILASPMDGLQNVLSEPMDEVENTIAEVWKEALNLESIDKTQDFYDLGADSLIMGNVASTIKDRFEGRVPFDGILIQMLNYPTVESLAEFIRGELDG